MSKPRIQLSDKLWAHVKASIPKRQLARAPGCTRRFVEGVIWVLRTGSPWRDLPAWFGGWQKTFKRFRRWVTGGLWSLIYASVNRTGGRHHAVFVDSTYIRVHQHGCGGSERWPESSAVGISRGGRTTKVHVAVTADDTLCALHITGGQVADICVAEALLEEPFPHHWVADRAYDSDALVRHLELHGIKAVIPSRRHRSHRRPLNRRLFGERYRVERFFAHLKQFRRVATRYDQSSASYRTFIIVAHTLLMGRRKFA